MHKALSSQYACDNVQAARDKGQRQKQLWHGRIPPLNKRRASSGDGLASPAVASPASSPARHSTSPQSGTQTGSQQQQQCTSSPEDQLPCASPDQWVTSSSETYSRLVSVGHAMSREALDFIGIEHVPGDHQLTAS